MSKVARSTVGHLASLAAIVSLVAVPRRAAAQSPVINLALQQAPENGSLPSTLEESESGGQAAKARPDPSRERYQGGEHFRTAGIALTVVGGILLITSLAFLIAGAEGKPLVGNSCGDCGPAQLSFGLMMGGGAVLFGGVGGVLWYVGDKRMDEARLAGYSPMTLLPPARLAARWELRF